MSEELKLCDDKEAVEAANQLREVKMQIDTLSILEKALKEKLTTYADKESVEIAGVKVFRYESWEKKQTPAQYVKENKIKLSVIDLDEPEISYRVTVGK